MYTDGVVGELAAFVRGAEDLATFEKFGCKYWHDNAAQWAENYGKPESDWRIGKAYGSLWRDFEGVDQLAVVIENLKSDPYSRRHVVSAWYPGAEACLPPCHLMYQFYVRQGFLHCHVYMRSVDLCVGLPSDIALYGVLMSLVAKDVGLKPSTLTFSFGDCHIYENHVEPFITVQAGRLITRGPKLLLADTASTLTFEPHEVQFREYAPAPPIKYAFNA
jgi:thymidylate synthase